MKRAIALLLWIVAWPLPAAAATLPAGVSAGPSYGGISEYRLDNGLTVLLYPDQSKPRMLVNVTYLVGSKHENYGETGMAHLLEHLLFKGTPKFPDIDTEFGKRGMRNNGTTSADRTNYFEVFEANLDSLHWALAMEASRMTDSFVAKADLDSEMTVVRNEMESGETEPFRVSLKNLLALAYQWHNYGNDTIGARADVENVPIERLQAFYRTWYQPDNAVLLVAGAFPPEPTLAKIAELFGPIPKPTRTLPPLYTREPAQDGAREASVRRIGGTPLLLAGYHVPGGGHPDMLALKLLAIVLGDDQTGRLRARLVDAGLAAAAGAFPFDNRDSGLLLFYAQLTRAQDLAKARAAFEQGVETLATEPVTEAEFDRARVKYRNQLKAALDDVSRLGVALSEYIALGDWRLFFWEQQQLQQLDLEQVNRVAATYLKPVNRNLVSYLPVDAVERVEIPAAPAPASLVAELAQEERTELDAGFVLEPAEIEKHVQRLEPRPGLELVLLPKPTRNQTVQFQIALQYGDEASLRGQQHAADAVGELLLRGTAELDRIAFDDAREQLEASLNAGSGVDELNLGGRTTRPHLAATLALAASALKQPRFDPAEFETWRQESLAALEHSENDPQALAGEAVAALLDPYPAGHPRAHLSLAQRKQALQQLKLEQVRAFHERFVNGARMQVAAVGDFDPAELGKLVEQQFGDWDQAAVAYVRMPDRPSTRTGASTRVDTPDQASGVLLAVAPLALTDRHPDFPALTLANYVLGGGALESRIMMRLRQKEGWSYGAGTALEAGLVDPSGQWLLYAMAAPENLEKARAAAHEELQRMADQGIDQAELDAAKAGWLKARRVGFADDARLVGMFSNQAQYDRSMREHIELEAAIAALTVEQVNAAARKYLKPDEWNVVLAGDAKKMAQAKAP